MTERPTKPPACAPAAWLYLVGGEVDGSPFLDRTDGLYRRADYDNSDVLTFTSAISLSLRSRAPWPVVACLTASADDGLRGPWVATGTEVRLWGPSPVLVRLPLDLSRVPARLGPWRATIRADWGEWAVP